MKRIDLFAVDARLLLRIVIMFIVFAPCGTRNEAYAQWSHKEGDPLIARPLQILAQPFSKAEWEASNFASEEDLQWFRDAKYGMFLCYGLSTRVKKEMSFSIVPNPKAPDIDSGYEGPFEDKDWKTWPQHMKLEKFNAKEYVEIAKRGGFKYIVLVVKHCDGFHLWDTAHSEFKVTNTPFGRDFTKEIVDACHAANMPIGLYYCQRDWYHPDYMPVDPEKVTRNSLYWDLKPGETSPLGENHQKYIDYQYEVCEELLTKYGKIDLFWWDAAWWGGMFTADMWDGENITRRVRELQPDIIQNNRCSVPGDFDTPEQRLGGYQDWRPWESCMPLTSNWCYTGTATKPLEQIIAMVVRNACNDGNFLLSWGPQWNGEFAESEKARLFEIGDWLKENGRAIYATRGGPWKTAAWGGSTRNGKKVYLHILERPGETLRLPALPERRVQSATLLNGKAVSFSQNNGILSITLPEAKPGSVDTIVELVLDKSADGLAAIGGAAPSIFADSITYGQVVSHQATVKASSSSQWDPPNSPQTLVAEKPAGGFAFHTVEEMNPWVEIDLGKEISVTGVRVLNRANNGQDRAATLRLSVSNNGKDWDEVWKAEGTEQVWHIPVTEYRGGAYVPGRKARYIRLETRPDAPEFLHLQHVKVWGKKL